MHRASAVLLHLVERSKTQSPETLKRAARLVSARHFNWLAAADYSERLYLLAVSGRWLPNYDEVHEMVLHLAYGHHGETLDALVDQDFFPDIPGYDSYVRGLSLFCSGSDAWPSAFAQSWQEFSAVYGQGEPIPEFAAQSKSYALLCQFSWKTTDHQLAHSGESNSQNAQIVVSSDTTYFEIFFYGFIRSLGKEWAQRVNWGLVIHESDSEISLRRIRQICYYHGVNLLEIESTGHLATSTTLTRFEIAQQVVKDFGSPVLVMDVDLHPSAAECERIVRTRVDVALSVDGVTGVPWARTNAGFCFFNSSPNGVLILQMCCDVIDEGRTYGLTWTADQAVLDWVVTQVSQASELSALLLPHDFGHRLGRQISFSAKRRKQSAKRKNVAKVALEDLRKAPSPRATSGDKTHQC